MNWIVVWAHEALSTWRGRLVSSFSWTDTVPAAWAAASSLPQQASVGKPKRERISVWGQHVVWPEACGQHVATQIICSTSVKKPQHSFEETAHRKQPASLLPRKMATGPRAKPQWTSMQSVEKSVRRQLTCDKGEPINAGLKGPSLCLVYFSIQSVEWGHTDIASESKPRSEQLWWRHLALRGVTDLFLGPVPFGTFTSVFLPRSWTRRHGPAPQEESRGVTAPLPCEHILPLMSFSRMCFSFTLLILSFPSGFYLPQAAVFSIENNTLTSLFFYTPCF